jgi:hypothetical protein
MFAAMVSESALRFRSLERGGKLEVGGSISISSLRDEELAKTILLRKQEVVGLLDSHFEPEHHLRKNPLAPTELNLLGCLVLFGPQTAKPPYPRSRFPPLFDDR